MNELTKVDFDHEMKVNETFIRVMIGDVTLAAEIAEKQKDPAKLQKLINHLQKQTESHFATKMAQHGVFDAAEIAALKTTLKISEPKITSRLELAATEFAELLASERIEREQANGLKQCDSHCGHAARIVANAVRDNFS